MIRDKPILSGYSSGMLTNEEVQAIVAYGRETQSVEFKQDGSPVDKSFAALVARAAMALSNRRDGGHIILGIVDNDPAGAKSGMSDDNVAAWLEHDDTMARLNIYADPPMSLNVEVRSLIDGRQVVVIEVSEFDTIPTLCNRDFPGKLMRGELYTRSLAKPESSRSQTQNELRTVLELGTQKQLRRFIETSRRAGIEIGLPRIPTDESRFAEQSTVAARELAVTDLGPRFEVEIYPSTFTQRRVDYSELSSLVLKCAVDVNSWRVPTDPQTTLSGDDWVGGKNSWHSRPDKWRMMQSGMLYVVQPVPSDFGPDVDGEVKSKCVV